MNDLGSKVKNSKPKVDGYKPSVLSELLGCPYCGEKHDLKEYVTYDFMDDKSVRCENCGALGPPCSTWKQAKEEWNHRAT